MLPSTGMDKKCTQILNSLSLSRYYKSLETNCQEVSKFPFSALIAMEKKKKYTMEGICATITPPVRIRDNCSQLLPNEPAENRTRAIYAIYMRYAICPIYAIHAIHAIFPKLRLRNGVLT